MSTKTRMQHSPKPWKFHLGRGAHPSFHVVTEGCYRIASTPPVSGYKPEADAQEANARLIAGSPEAYELLRLCELEVMPTETGGNMELWQSIRAYLSKVEGGKEL